MNQKTKFLKKDYKSQKWLNFLFQTKTSTVLNLLYKNKQFHESNFRYVKKLYTNRPTKNFQHILLKLSRPMQVSKPWFFLLTTKNASHDSQVNFE